MTIQPNQQPQRRVSPLSLQRPSLLPELLTQFAPLTAVLALLERVAPTEAPVLIVGEPGTGKTLIARAIHSASRRGGALVEIDASALPADLLDLELFGADPGSVRDAHRKSGALELGTHGTVLIDEIAGVGSGTQSRLLNAATKGSFLRSGGKRRIEFTARLLSTTSHSVASLDRDDFDRELLDLLRTAYVELPPLRDRRTDIPLLAQQFCAQFGAGRGIRLTADAVSVLENHDWPGNVRELRSIVERAVMTAGTQEIGGNDISSLLASAPSTIGAPIKLADLERRHIQSVLQQTNWHQGRAATVLGISSKTLYRKIREYGFERPARES